MKSVMLGITGSISAYKSILLMRELQKLNYDIKVVLTEAAARFTPALTFETFLPPNSVFIDMWENENETLHIELAKTDLVIVAPATANTIAKVANGICDNLLSTILLATKAPKLFVPAMNTQMLENPITQENIRKLENAGAIFVDSEYGQMACKTNGKGRYPDIDKIIIEAEKTLYTDKKLRGKNVLITCGGTREPIDPVRFIGNNSTGTMGYYLAKEAYINGANVTLICANCEFPNLPEQINQIKVKTAEEMQNEVIDQIENSDTLIMSAAVADYRPLKEAKNKIKKSEKNLSLQLERTSDILLEVRQWRGKSKNKLKVIGFAAETDNLEKNARKKLKKKDLDMIIVNKVPEAFGGGKINGFLITKNKELELKDLEKSTLSQIIFDQLKPI